MKMTCLILAFFIGSLAQPAFASRDAGFERMVDIKACELTSLQSALLNQKWNKLSMRFFMVSIENADNPYLVKQVRADVDQALAELRDEYGTDCVLDIL